MNHILNTAEGSGEGSYYSTPSPPAIAERPGSLTARRTGASSPTLLHTHRDSIIQSAWFRNNQVEPPMEPDDPLIRHGLLTTESSRFDLFIHSVGDRHNCLYVEPGSTERCSYSNFRRQRVKVHVLSHFSYKPFTCDGSCGKANWWVTTPLPPFLLLPLSFSCSRSLLTRTWTVAI